jgi:hypothetical protein
MKLVEWNGTDVPEAMKALPPGRYVLQPVDELVDLDPEEDGAIRDGLAQLERGEWADHDDVMERARRAARR